jgi:hypothetical protein
MKHKNWLVGLLVAMLALSSTGFAYAQAPQPPLGRGDRRGALIEGEVTAIDGDALTVETRHRGTLTVQTDESTRFRAKGDPDFSLADIRAGDTIAAQGRFVEAGTLLARVVALVPPELSDQARGRVTAVEGDTITIDDADGNPIEIATSDETRFRVKGQPDVSIDDVEVGMNLGAIGQFDAGGVLAAKHVVAAQPRGPKGGPIEAGKVASVDGAELTLEFPDGSTLAVTTDASTIVIVRGDEGPALGSIGDVSEGAPVVVMGVPSGNGNSIAARVILLGRGPQS